MTASDPATESTAAPEQVWETRNAASLGGRAFARAFDLAHAMIRGLDGRISFWSSSMERLYGWPREEALGRISHDLLKTVFPQPLSEIEAALFGAGHWEGELRHQSRDGRTVIVASHWALDRDEHGRPAAVIEVNNDITASKLAEEALELQQTRMRRLLESNIIGILVGDRQGIVDANDAFLGIVGYSREDLKAGRLAWRDMTPPEYVQLDDAALLELEARGECTPFEKEYRRKDGTRVPILIGAVQLQAEEPSWVCFVMDITERKRAEAALRLAKETAEQVARSKSRVLAAVGHDLKQPVQIIAMALSMLAPQLTAPRQQQLLARAERSTDKLAAALDTLLEVARLESGVVKPRIEAFPIQKLLDEIEDQFGILAAHKGLWFDVVPSAAQVLSDAKMLGTILHNLVGNAIKYTARGGIIVSCRQRDGILSIEVRDTGIGIPPDKLELVFEEFQQLEPGGGEGLGLGLTIVRRTAEALGHPIGVQSSVGEGSTFSIEIPGDVEPAPLSPSAIGR